MHELAQSRQNDGAQMRRMRNDDQWCVLRSVHSVSGACRRDRQDLPAVASASKINCDCSSEQDALFVN